VCTQSGYGDSIACPWPPRPRSRAILRPCVREHAWCACVRAGERACVRASERACRDIRACECGRPCGWACATSLGGRVCRRARACVHALTRACREAAAARDVRVLLAGCCPPAPTSVRRLRARLRARPHLGLLELVALDLLLALGLAVGIGRVQRLVLLLAHPRDRLAPGITAPILHAPARASRAPSPPPPTQQAVVSLPRRCAALGCFSFFFSCPVVKCVPCGKTNQAA
jgi:hypothetical protein